MMMFIRECFIGIRRHPWRIVKYAFVCYSVLWTIVESAAYFLRTAESGRPPLWEFLGLGAISIWVGIWMGRQRSSVRIRSNAFHTLVEIRFGNIFSEDGVICVPVNEFFDSKLGRHVSEASLHGMVIRDYFGSHPEAFDKCVEDSLVDQEYLEVDRTSGRHRQYAIGTTAVVPASQKTFLCVALTKTNLDTLKASANVSQLWMALAGVLRTARSEANGRTVAMPLMGAGLSGTGLHSIHLIQLLLLAIYEESRKQIICDKVQIILPREKLGEIDLATIQRFWR